MSFKFPTYVLRDETRGEFREPLGELIKGDIEECSAALLAIVRAEKPMMIALVGDAISRTIHGRGVTAKVRIIDNKERREPVAEYSHVASRTIRLSNQAGTINEAAWAALQEAFEGQKDTLVIVEGEEDLLALVVVETAPDGALVVYGQPSEGIVVVRVNEASKRKVRALLQKMTVREGA